MKRRQLLAAALLLVVTTTFDAVTALKDEEIDESSGLATSALNPGIVWTHNDSGDTARGFAVDLKTGETRLVLNVKGAEAHDWEDMAATGGQLYFGDIGDNKERRQSYAIYRVPEPRVPKSGRQTIEIAPAQTLAFRYPDGSHNAETLLVHPKTHRIYIVTKAKSGKSGVYTFPTRYEGSVATLEKVASLDFGGINPLDRLVTGGDISPDGRHVALVTYAAVYELDAPADTAKFDQVWSSPQRRTVHPALRQWEAVAYEQNGKSVLVDSEGKGAPIYRLAFRK